jgi:hypothetical protein
VPVAVVFRCEICSARPDPETQISLERQLLDLRHGEYVDADPGRWLTWHGRGIYGPLGWHPWASGPHPWAGRRGSDRARALARRLRSSFGAPGM